MYMLQQPTSRHRTKTLSPSYSIQLHGQVYSPTQPLAQCTVHSLSYLLSASKKSARAAQTEATSRTRPCMSAVIPSNARQQTLQLIAWLGSSATAADLRLSGYRFLSKMADRSGSVSGTLSWGLQGKDARDKVCDMYTITQDLK